ncbi:hypothetical protein FI667_g883, partial [Globisporangium splendens]
MMRAGLKSVVLAAAVLLVAATHAAELSYPKCVDGASGCCSFGSGKMKSPGYAVIRMDVDTIVTCSHGSLQCFEGNPNLRGGTEGNKQIDCPASSLLKLATLEVAAILRSSIFGKDGKVEVYASISSVLSGAFSVKPRETSTKTPHLRRDLKMYTVDVNLLFGTPEGTRTLQQLETAPTIIAICALLLGSALCCAGARFRKYSTLVCAFLDGALFISWLLQSFFQGEDQWQSTMSWTCFFLGGILLCLTVLWSDTFGRFVIGLTAGLLLGFGCNTTFGLQIHPEYPEMTLVGLLVVLGAASGFLAAKRPYWGVIISTSWIGANTMAWGLGYFVGQYPNGASLAKFRNQDSRHSTIPSVWWGYLAGTLVCFLFGTLLQHCASEDCHFSQTRGGDRDHYTSADKMQRA